MILKGIFLPSMLKRGAEAPGTICCKVNNTRPTESNTNFTYWICGSTRQQFCAFSVKQFSCSNVAENEVWLSFDNSASMESHYVISFQRIILSAFSCLKILIQRESSLVQGGSMCRCIAKCLCGQCTKCYTQNRSMMYF